MYDLTGFQRDLLRVIAASEENLHGLGIKEKVESEYDKEIHHGRLYPNLDTLAEMGLVRKEQVDRRTNSYSLTPRGKTEVEYISGKWAEVAPA